MNNDNASHRERIHEMLMDSIRRENMQPLPMPDNKKPYWIQGAAMSDYLKPDYIKTIIKYPVQNIPGYRGRYITAKTSIMPKDCSPLPSPSIIHPDVRRKPRITAQEVEDESAKKRGFANATHEHIVKSREEDEATTAKRDLARMEREHAALRRKERWARHVAIPFNWWWDAILPIMGNAAIVWWAIVR